MKSLTNISFEDMESEIEQNLSVVREYYTRIEELNIELGEARMRKDFFDTVKDRKITSFFRFVGTEMAMRLTSKHCI